MDKRIIAKKLIRKVMPSGNSGHVNVGKEFIGDIAEVKIIRKWIVCKRCSQTFTNKKNFSPDDNYCLTCYDAIKFLKKNKNLKCKKCKKKMTAEEYKNSWNNPICEACFVVEIEEAEEN